MCFLRAEGIAFHEKNVWPVGWPVTDDCKVRRLGSFLSLFFRALTHKIGVLIDWSILPCDTAKGAPHPDSVHASSLVHQGRVGASLCHMTSSLFVRAEPPALGSVEGVQVCSVGRFQ